MKEILKLYKKMFVPGKATQGDFKGSARVSKDEVIRLIFSMNHFDGKEREINHLNV